MLLLNNLNERGYNQLKKDRDILIKEIEQLNSILSQFDLAYPFLSSIFEPEIEIKYHKTNDIYAGYFKIEHPNFDIPIFKSVTLGSSKRYNGIKDPQLLIDGRTRARKMIQKLFPEMFEDVGQ